VADRPAEEGAAPGDSEAMADFESMIAGVEASVEEEDEEGPGKG
jgi:hypothetical protein